MKFILGIILLVAALHSEDLSNVKTFNIKLLNKINLLDNEIAYAKNEEVIKRYQGEKDALIQYFLERLKEGDFATLKQDNREELYNRYLVQLHDANKKKDVLGVLIAQMMIYIVSMERTFEVFLMALHEYNNSFMPLEEYEKLFMKFSQNMSFSNKEYQRVYDKLLTKGSLDKQEMQYLNVYERFDDMERIYNELFFIISKETYEALENNTILTSFGVENTVLYLNELGELEEANDYAIKWFGVTVGQIIVAVCFFIFIILFKEIVIDFILLMLDRMIRKKSEDGQKHSSVRLKRYLDISLRRPVYYFIYFVALDVALRIILIQINNQSIVNYFVLGYILLFVWAMFRMINNFVLIYSDNVLKRYPNVRGEMVNFFVNFSKIFILVIGLLIVLNNLGYDVSGLVASLGIGGLAIAFAARETIANIFGSVSVIMDNIFTQGDWIVVDGIEGTVVDIGMRSTKVRTFDNAMIYVPNATMASAKVRNWNQRKLGRRIYMHLGATYDSDPNDLKQAVTDIRAMLTNHPDIANASATHELESAQITKIVSKDLEYGIKKTLLVFLDRFSDSSIDIMVYCFSKTVEWDKWLAVKEDVIFKIIDIFEKNNLTFAFPSQSIYWQNDSKRPLEVEHFDPERITPETIKELKS